MNRKQIIVAAGLAALGTRVKLAHRHTEQTIRDSFYWLNNPRFANRTVQGLMTVNYDKDGRQRSFTYRPLV